MFVIVLYFAIRAAIDGNEGELGFKTERRRSRWIGLVVVTDFDFADDIIRRNSTNSRTTTKN